MRDKFYKYLPLVSGTLLGWMIWNPPAWLASLGPLSYLVNLALVALLLVSLVAVVIVTNLPAKLELEPVDDAAVDPELRALAGEFERLGFRRAGPARRVKIAPSAVVLGFVHEKEPVYGTAFRTETAPPKTSCDFVSILHGDRGGLTTNTDPAGAALAGGDGSLRQVFPGEALDDLFRKHLEGIAYLRQRGVHCRNVSADMFPRDLAMGIARQREDFTSAPLRGTLITLWRAATKQVPFLGALRDQAIAEGQISRLLASVG